MPLGFLFLLCYLLFFRGLGDRDLWSSHEGRAAMDAQSLLDDGFASLPRLYDGRQELQKPPLYYVLVALAAKANGDRVDAWCVRLPAALMATAVVVGLYLFGRRLRRPLMGLTAAVVAATAVHFTWLARVGRIDMPLSLTTGAALAAFYLRSRGNGGLPTLVFAYLALAAGVLLKGPIGAVLPLAVAGTWLLLRRELTPRRLLFHYGLAWGLPLVVAIVAPIYLWADAVSEGAFTRVFWWYHNVARGFGGAAELEAHPWWLYGPRLLADFAPWSLALPVALGLYLRGKRDDTEAQFGLTWLLTMLLMLSAMRFKRADYLLPAYAGGALFLGAVAERLFAGHERRLLVGMSAVAVIALISWEIFYRLDRTREPEREYVRFAAEVRRLAPEPRPVLLFRTEAHALAFHLGRPLTVFVEWEALDALAARAEETFVVMPEKVAREWPRELRSGRLVEVLRNSDLPGAARHEKPLVLLRTRP